MLSPFPGEAFEYTPRVLCVCGTRVIKLKPALVRQTAFGLVSFVRCTACGTYVQSPQITVDSLAIWYNSLEYQGGSGGVGATYLDYSRDERARIIEAKSRFNRYLAPILPPRARVLEIGCATGSLLSIIRAAGHTVSGVDLSARFAAFAHELYELDVVTGDFLQMMCPAGTLDAVIMLGTISNLQNLDSSLVKIRTLLKTDGFLLFNFPYADSFVAKLYGPKYWMFAPSVSNFMSVAGCQAALACAGLALQSIGTDYQQPSLGKLLHHSRLDRVLPETFLRHANRPLPLPLPIPPVKIARAIKRVSNL